MKLTAKHPDFEDAEVLCSYSLDGNLSDKQHILLSNLKSVHHKYLMRSFIPPNDEGHKVIIIPVLATISLCLAIFALETGVITMMGASLSGNFTEDYSHLIWVLLLMYLLYLGIAKSFTDVRYLVFDGDLVIAHTKKRGAWPMPLKDVRFHIIKASLVNKQYFLEVELPEKSFPDYHRMIIIEVAARREVLEGMLAVLLPLLRGEKDSLEHAQKRRYAPIPRHEKPSFLRRYDNCVSHLHIWFQYYKINQFLFWLVHGRRKKVMERYI